jgi:hypothetical protein
MQRFKHGFRMGLRDAEEGAGGAFGAAVALFSVRGRAGADADVGGVLIFARLRLFRGFVVSTLV